MCLLKYTLDPYTGFFFQHYSLTVYFRLAVEGSLVVYSIFLTVLFTIFGLFSVLVIKFVYDRQLLAQNSTLKRGLLQVSQSRIRPSSYALLIKRYRHMHSAIWRNLYLAKVQVVDDFIFTVILTTMSLHVTLMSKLLIYRLQPSEVIVATIALITGTAVYLLGCSALANATQVLYSSTRYLHLSTSYLSGADRLVDKLKMAAHYEALQSKSRLFFSVGSLLDINKELYVNYVFIYTGYVFYVLR